MEINKCRACLKETFSQLLCWTAPIETGNSKSITYLECFKMCTRLGVKKHDKLPQTLCFQCAAELRFTHKFIKKAMESLEILLVRQEEFVKIEENVGPAATQNEFVNMVKSEEPKAARELFIKKEEDGEPFIPKAINKCRVCLVESFSQLLCWTVPIEIDNHESITYLEYFEICTRLGAIKHDQLPQTLCFQCVAELRFAYKFIKKAMQSQEILLMEQEELVKMEKNEEAVPTLSELLNPKRVEVKRKLIKIAAQPAVPPELQKTYYFVKTRLFREKAVKQKAKKMCSRRIVVPKEQKQILLNHIKANLALGGGIPKSELSKPLWEYHKKIWEKIAVDLNSTHRVRRSAPQWKQVWFSWKYKVKCQYIAIKRFEAQIQAGLELPSSDKPKKLNELDEQIVQLFFEFKDNELIKKRGFHPATSKEYDDFFFEEYLNDE